MPGISERFANMRVAGLSRTRSHTLILCPAFQSGLLTCGLQVDHTLQYHAGNFRAACSHTSWRLPQNSVTHLYTRGFSEWRINIPVEGFIHKSATHFLKPYLAFQKEISTYLLQVYLGLGGGGDTLYYHGSTRTARPHDAVTGRGGHVVPAVVAAHTTTSGTTPRPTENERTRTIKFSFFLSQQPSISSVSNIWHVFSYLKKDNNNKQKKEEKRRENGF